MTPIYLDYQATTPLAPEVAAAMEPWLAGGKFGNPHSSHRLGREAAAAVEVARERVMATLAAAEGMLYFTSGATEAINWALKGALARLPEARRSVVTIATEHAAVLDTVEWLGRMGVTVDVLPVGFDGLVDLDLAAERITPNTGIVAAMLVNNEIGVIQPVAALGQMARAAGALFMCDAVQGWGRARIPLGVCSMVAISAHKMHGPKGIGALWVRDGVALDPLMHGGGQEGGLRSGTLSPALCAGFGEAAYRLMLHGGEDNGHVARLTVKARDYLQGWTLNGSLRDRYPGNLNIRRPGLDAARLIADVREVAFSAGSACASGSGRPSHVLRAIGLTDAEARSSIRLGFGRYTTEDELKEALTLINAAADRQTGWTA